MESYPDIVRCSRLSPDVHPDFYPDRIDAVDAIQISIQIGFDAVDTTRMSIQISIQTGFDAGCYFLKGVRRTTEETPTGAVRLQGAEGGYSVYP
eukprot:1189949-Prorocentrum_minimum.AAC.5